VTRFREITTQQALPPAYAYSQALGYGDLVFTQGVNPCDPVTAQVVGKTVEEQTTQAMQNLAAILAAAGGSAADIIKVSVHLADLLRDFEGFDRVYRSYLTPPYPVRTTVGATLWHDYLIEIDVVACIPQPPPGSGAGQAAQLSPGSSG
jgi:2-iminobutanoate/2-iminopropanoate deaminase